VTLADPRGEIDRGDQESEDSGECMRDEEAAVGDDLQTVGMVHRVIVTRRTSEVMKTKSAVRPRETQRIVLNLEPAVVRSISVEVA